MEIFLHSPKYLQDGVFKECALFVYGWKMCGEGLIKEGLALVIEPNF